MFRDLLPQNAHVRMAFPTDVKLEGEYDASDPIILDLGDRMKVFLESILNREVEDVVKVRWACEWDCQ